MIDSREIIEWLIETLPPGFQWAGRPIVVTFFLCAAIAFAVAAWAAWKGLASLMRDGKDDHDA